MEQEVIKKLNELEQELAETTKMVRQLRNYFLWTMIISILVIVLPLIGLALVIPNLLSSYSSLGI